MQRIVIVNSYENIKEALIQRATDIAGRPHDSLPMKIVTYDFKALGIMDYDRKFVFMRKLAYKSLHFYGSGMAKIEEIISDEVDKLCSFLSKESENSILIHQFLGMKDNFPTSYGFYTSKQCRDFSNLCSLS